MAADAAGGKSRRHLGGIVLAAGGGVRFGGPKQLALLDGLSLVARASRLALRLCPAGVVVVTGAYASEVRDNVAGSPVIIAHNGAWASGMAGSIRCGLDALPAGARACLVMLCDQCAVDDQDLGALIAAWVRAPWQVAAAQYAGTLGVPAIFPTEFWPALRALSGDQGARAVIASLPEVTAVALPNAARDVDTPADLGVGTGP